ncbi:hypothetical protein KJ562_00185 [Patescibacteria group bacterium]|nr:hypothetical protein [Patescibacteria group bacterium]
MENIKTILKEHQEEIKRHISVLKEDVDQKIGLIGEQHGSIIAKLDSHSEMIESMSTRLDSHGEMIASIKEDTEIVKINVELIKDSLKRKVDVDEFATLERRVGVLEARAHRG